MHIEVTIRATCVHGTREEKRSVSVSKEHLFNEVDLAVLAMVCLGKVECKFLGLDGKEIPPGTYAQAVPKEGA